MLPLRGIQPWDSSLLPEMDERIYLLEVLDIIKKFAKNEMLIVL